MGVQDFIIRVVVDPTQAAAGSRAAADALGGVTDAGAKAQKSTGDLSDRFQKLRAEIDPVVAAQQKLLSSTELLFSAQRAGITTMGEVARLMQIQQANLTGSLEPYEQVLASLQRETQLLTVSSGEREISNRMLQLENELREQGILLTEGQSAALAEQLRLQQTIQAEQAASAETGALGKAAGAVGLGGGVKGIAGALGGLEIIHLADELGNLQNRIRSVTSSDEDFSRVEQRLYDVAQHTRSGWEQTAEVYQRVEQATRELGLTEDQVIDFTRELAEAFRVAGVSTGEQARVTRDLLHGLDQGTLQWRQLQAIMAQTPSIARIIAEHFGVATGKLKDLAKQGQITGQAIVAAFKEQDGQLEQQLGKTMPTLSQAWAQFENSVMRVLEKLSPVIKLVAEAISALADVIGFATDHWEAFAIALAPVTGGLTLIPVAIKEVGGALSWIGDKINGFTDAIGLGGETVFDTMRKMQALREETDKLTASIDASTLEFQKWNTLAFFGVDTKALAAKMVIGDLTKAIDALAEKQKLITVAAFTGTGDFKGEDSTTKRLTTESIDRMREAHTKNAEAARKAAEESHQLDEELAKLEGKEDEASKAALELARANDVLSRAVAAGKISEDDANEIRDRTIARIALQQIAADKTIDQMGSINDLLDEQSNAAKAALASDSELTKQMGEEMTKKLEEGQKALEGLAAAFKKVGEATIGGEMQRALDTLDKSIGKELVGAIGQVSQALAKMVVEGNASWSAFEDIAIKTLENVIAKMIEAKLLEVALSIFGGGNTTAAAAAGAASVIGGGGHAYGGSYTVPGTGGADTQPVLFMLTPGEKVHFQPPGQGTPAAAGGTPAAAPDVHVHNHLIFDSNFVPGAMATPAGHRTMMEFVRINASQISALLGK